MKEWITPAIATFVFWGLYVFLQKVVAQYIGPKSATVFLALGSLSVTLAILFSLNFRPEVHPKAIAFAVVAGIFVNLGNVAFLVAVSKGPLSLVAPFTALYPALAIVLAIVTMNEPITPRKGVGILLSLVAMLLISI
jgi:transporter family protein